MLDEASIRDIGYETTVQKIIDEETKAFFADQKILAIFLTYVL
ncbi:hypothetical protein [Cohnella yongneupensis]|uniref:Uncharacterized protein n=1 Tax=Cohnella yongneupensis TaxID=425006 RepID=A0ABW0R1F7_9BACL